MRVADGDTLQFGQVRIRLQGIDAPELDQMCTDRAGAAWECGLAARQQLGRLIGNHDVACLPEGRDQYDRVLARCTAGGHDLGGALVAAGMAVAYGDYQREEATARAGHLGMWEGTFQSPRSWRDRPAEGDPWGWLRAWFG